MSADPVCNVLDYRPHLKSGDAQSMESVPLPVFDQRW